MTGICYEMSYDANDDEDKQSKLADVKVEEVFMSLHNSKIPRKTPQQYTPTEFGFEYDQDGDMKPGSATLGHGIVIAEDSIVVGLPMFNKLWTNKMGGIMKVKDKKFTKFDKKLDTFKNKLKIHQKGENFDIANSYLGWSIIKGNGYRPP